MMPTPTRASRASGRRGRWVLQALLATVVLALACVAILPFALYRVGLSDIPDERLRAEVEAAPAPAIALMWQGLGGTGRPRI